MPFATHEVLIVGGGPTGLMLAGELALAGIDVAIIEKRITQELVGSRAGGLHARTIEVLDQRGIADRFLAKGRVRQVVAFNMVTLDISDFPTRHAYGLGLFQHHFEDILAAWVDELGVPTYRGCEVVDLVQTENEVDATLSDGRTLRAQYLAGCDGGRSNVRRMAGIDFPGWDPTMSWLIAEAQMSAEPVWGPRQDALGLHGLMKVEEPGRERVRILLTEPEPRLSAERSLQDLKDMLVTVYGSDYGVHSPSWISSFTDVTRQAATYRKGRVLLAGDAAHIHPPIGGQGLNIGVQDAVNLGWKLAQVVRRVSSEQLLESYHNERHPVGARVLKNTMAQTALRRQESRIIALGAIVGEFLNAEETRKKMAAEISGLGVHYDLGDGHPLLGRRMPDLDLETANGRQRVYHFLHKARPVLLSFGPEDYSINAWADRVQHVRAKYDGPWTIPVLGDISPPASVLVRPDGYVAWVGPQPAPSLESALSTWFGPA